MTITQVQVLAAAVEWTHLLTGAERLTTELLPGFSTAVDYIFGAA